MDDDQSKFKKRCAIALVVFGIYLLVVGFMTTDTSVGSNFTATRLMRVATIGGGSVCVLVGLLVAFLRTY